MKAPYLFKNYFVCNENWLESARVFSWYLCIFQENFRSILQEIAKMLIFSMEQLDSWSPCCFCAWLARAFPSNLVSVRYCIARNNIFRARPFGIKLYTNVRVVYKRTLDLSEILRQIDRVHFELSTFDSRSVLFNLFAIAEPLIYFPVCREAPLTKIEKTRITRKKIKYVVIRHFNK